MRTCTDVSPTSKLDVLTDDLNNSYIRNRDNDSTLIDLFHQCVELYPNAAALEDQTEGQFAPPHPQITYHDLHVASNCFSQRLRDHGVVAADIIPVLGRRSIDMVIALLAVLKLRASYVPIDLDSWGLDRIKTTLGMIDSHLLVSLDSTLDPSLEAIGKYDVVVLDDWSRRKYINLDITTNIQAIKAQLRDKTTALTLPTNDLAYIIFTSGIVLDNISFMMALLKLFLYLRHPSRRPGIGHQIPRVLVVLYNHSHI
jgi:non-ribosomal peptide synthetase component F